MSDRALPSPRMIDPARPEDWPPDVPDGIRRYLTALHGSGPARLAGNAAGIRGEIVGIGDCVLPVLVSDGRPGKASILSPIGHHVLYPLEEIGKRTSRPMRWALHALVWPLLAVFRAAALDRVVFVNHWLLSGAPAPNVPDAAWPALFAFLAARHPGHAIVVQDVKPAIDPELACALAAAGAIAVPTRTVAIFDPAAGLEGGRLKKKRYTIRRALAALKEAEGELLPLAVARSRPRDLVRLYRRSNIDRHSALNPAYTEAFFETALDTGEFDFRAWRAPHGPEDHIAVFLLRRRDDRTMHWSTFGAEPDDPSRPVSYYERIFASDLAEAMDQGLILDWGAGALDFKRYRGGRPRAQDEMVHIDHLPPHRRAAWRLLARLRTLRRRQVAGDDG